MIIPVRCFTCGKVIGDKWEKYLEKVEASEIIHADTDSLKKDHKSPEFEAMESLGITRMCCRRHFLTNIDVVDSI